MAIALGSACGSSTSPSLHPLIISIGLGFLAAALLCTIAAACWCLQQPVRLRALPAVLLAALLSARAGTALAHQVWWNDCSPPDGSTTLLLAAAPALAGRLQRWLSAAGLSVLSRRCACCGACPPSSCPLG